MPTPRTTCYYYPDVWDFYNEGKQAALSGVKSKSCPYEYMNLKAYCAWMGGWHDYNNGGE